MRASTLVSALAVAVPTVLAQNATSNSTSICDKYTTALLKTSNATTQYTLLTLLVNTAVIGNYTKDPAPKNAVTGILNNGTWDSRPVSLLKYFDGMLASSNRGGSEGVAVNFLDDGGATPLTNNKAANGTTSNQYFLLTHLYEYFGALLGCSAYGTKGYPAYDGEASQYEVHKFMDLSSDEVNYFIQEVGLSAASFGVSTEDITTVANKLNSTFNYRCAPKATVIPSQGAQFQSICVAESCPLAENSDCKASGLQTNLTMPVAANDTNKYTATPSSSPTGTSGSGSGSGSDATGSATNTDSGSGAESSGAASANALGAVFMGVAGLAALAAGL